VDRHQNFVGGNWVDAIDSDPAERQGHVMYALEDYATVKHVMARIVRQRAKG